MAENDIIFDVGLEADTSKIQQQIKNLRVPAIKIPTVIEKASARQRIISAKSGTHAKDVEYLGGLIVREALVTGSTPTQSYNRIMGSKAGMTPFQQQLGTQAVTFATQQINASKEQQRQENLATRIAERTAREESLLSQIQQTSDVANLPALTKKQLLGMGRSIQNIPVSQQTETQKKILAAANDLTGSLDNATKTNNKIISVLGNLGKLSAVVSLANEAIKLATRLADYGFEQALNPEYNIGTTMWLTDVGLSKEQASQAQSYIATFKRKMQMGQISDEERRAYALFGKDIYNTLLSDASDKEKITTVIKTIRSTNAEDRAQLIQASPLVASLARATAYSDEQIAERYERNVEIGESMQARVAGDLQSLLIKERAKGWAEKQLADFKNASVLGVAGAGVGILASVLTGGAAAPLIPILAGAGAGVGGGIDADQKLGGDNMFDYDKAIPVHETSTRPIENNITIPVYIDGELTETRHLTTRAEMGGI